MTPWQKDRLAIIITLIYSIVPMESMLFGQGESVGLGILGMLPVVVYWAYRWIKGNISIKNPNKNNP